MKEKKKNVVARLKMNNTERKHSEGITLIALVITIIVLLILAMVSIRIITNQGIIQHAENATERYTAEQEKELIGLAYSDYKMTKMNNSGYTMQEALDNEQAGAIAEGDETSGWTITFNSSGNQYTLTSEGTLTPVDGVSENEEGTTDFEALKQAILQDPNTYLQQAAELGQDIEQNKDIGIGTDGNIVNLDVWPYREENGGITIYGRGTGGSGYSGNVINGELETKIPQYILIDGSENFFEVISLDTGALGKITGLKTIELPTTLVNIGSHVFVSASNATSLTSVTIPNSVTTINNSGFNTSFITEIIIDNTEGAISGEPWGATGATVTWLR